MNNMGFRRYRSGRLGLISACALAAMASGALAQESRQITVEQVQILNLQPPPSTLGVDVWSNRADGTYQIGEELTLFIRVSHDAQVTVLNVDAVGRTTMLFPNQFAQDNRLRANTVYRLPGTDA